MHRLASSFVLGYHGCDKAVGEKLLSGESFTPSKNDYDWLGEGIYFWEANPKRGLEFAREMSRLPRFQSKYPNPFVIGAVIEMGNCLDLTAQTGIDYVKTAYKNYIQTAEYAKQPLVENKGIFRKLDCAVITYFHKIRERSGMPAIDTVKGIFIEGDPVYPGSGFHEKTHTQICVCNPDCIKGIFRVKSKDIF